MVTSPEIRINHKINFNSISLNRTKRAITSKNRGQFIFHNQWLVGICLPSYCITCICLRFSSRLYFRADVSCDQNFFYFLIFLATYFIFQYFTPPAVSFHSFCRKFYLFFLQPDILDAHDMLRFNISGKKIVDKFISLLVKSVLKLSLLPSRTSRNSIVLT